MEKYSRLVSVSGRTFRMSETMCDIFVAHSSDIAERGLLELVPLVHEGGVEILLIGPTTPIAVTAAGPIAVVVIAAPAVISDNAA